LGSTNVRRVQIPGISQLADEDALSGVFLLSGPAGVGKTMYCRQFLIDGLKNGEYCIFISSTLTENQFRRLFDDANQSTKNLSFTNPCQSPSTKVIASKLSASLRDIDRLIDKAKGRSVRIVVDSLTHILLVAGEKLVLKFMMDLSRKLRNTPATAICTLANSDQHLQSYLSTLARGIIEMKLEDNMGSLERNIRLLSIKGVHHQPVWIKFKITDEGKLVFEDQTTAAQTCTLCGRAIMGTPFTESDFVFDSKKCLETYRKLSGAFGSSIAETGLPSEAFNVSFFFIDIVGLSDPSLSVKKQVQKIETLNKLLSSCEAFRKTSKDKRILLPTGDGMAIGFLQNPSSPLELSIELHGKLRAQNAGKAEDDQVGVRIGLGSGPVFTVTDMNNVQNVWGPGIILARRVMDAGDNGHILLAGNLAQELIALKDEYRSIIKPVSDAYEIKHGHKISLYSVYSKDFGNPDMPAKIFR
jgi:KaiC/GvpD/RAD55 family RecA-like ATPase